MLNKSYFHIFICKIEMYIYYILNVKLIKFCIIPNKTWYMIIFILEFIWQNVIKIFIFIMFIIEMRKQGKERNWGG